jgi:hypothetical protein
MVYIPIDRRLFAVTGKSQPDIGLQIAPESSGETEAKLRPYSCLAFSFAHRVECTTPEAALRGKSLGWHISRQCRHDLTDFREIC